MVAVGLRHRPDDRVRDGPPAAPMSPPASWASTGNNHSWRPAGAWSSPRTSTRPTSRWPASTAWTRCGALLISGGISCGPGPLTPRRSATGPTRGPSGSRCCTGRTMPWRPPHRAPAPTSAPRAAGSGPSPTSMRTAYCRPATPERACCTRPPPRSSPRSATNGTGWPARVPLDNNKAVMRSVVRVHAAGVSRCRLAQYMGCLTGGSASAASGAAQPGKEQHRREVGDT